jgi:dihydrodipicolinate synthase/N-acetylneuraminate lyase
MEVLCEEKLRLLYQGTVIPAHPLALNDQYKLDEIRQRRLTRYYIASGAGGVAIGVHTTQFEIRRPEINLLETVFRLAAEEVEKAELSRPFLKVAGVCGQTEQAIDEAKLAVKYGYDLGLVSMAAFGEESEEEVLEHIKTISEIIPVFGFYLQAAIGGRIYSYNFWREFVNIPNVLAIKVAAFNRYQTLDVVRAICNSPRRNEIALYTGNDDNIVADLLTPYQFNINGKLVEKRFCGGLLGHWAAWTEKAVTLLDEIKETIKSDSAIPEEWLTRNIEVTDMNAAIFDPANHFDGCIAGIHQVLHKQGLLEGIWCLNPRETLSEGQAEEIERVCKDYPHLIDDEFVHAFLQNETISVI